MTTTIVRKTVRVESSPPPRSDQLSPSPIRVGFVMHKMQVAGAEVLVAETIRRLRDKIEATILCLDGIGQLGEQLLDEGVSVVSLGRRAGRDWSVAYRLAREARAQHLDVIHSHQYTPFFYSALARILLRGRPKLIFTEHGRHYPDEVSTARRWGNRLFFRHFANETNAVCEFSARSLATNDGFARSRIGVIENGIDVDQYQPVIDRSERKTELGLNPDRRYVATVARFHPVKDHASLLRGFALAAPRIPDVDLLLVGDGPLRPELDSLTSTLGLQHRVHFLGVRRDVDRILGAVDLFAMTSLSEAASLTLLEAMASGLPALVTAVGGNPEIVRHGQDGLLVPRGDTKQISEAFVQLLSDPDASTAMGMRARQRVQDRYQLNRTIDRYYQLYQQLTASKRVTR